MKALSSLGDLFKFKEPRKELNVEFVRVSLFINHINEFEKNSKSALDTPSLVFL